MAQKCKCCSLPDDLRSRLNDRIMQGDVFKDLEQWLKGEGHALTSVGIMRHANSHIEGFTPRSELPAVVNVASVPQTVPAAPELMAIDTSEIMTRLGVTEIDVNSFQGIRQYTSKAINQLVANQAIIAVAKQESYMQGEGGYPKDELRGLMDLMKLAGLIKDVGLISGTVRQEDE